LDIARRVGSGIGSYGVDRFYVLLKGKDTSLSEDDGDPSVILDIKFEPMSAVSRTLNEDNKAWYNHVFKNEADRTALAQRALTSFTDPFVGWIEIDGNPYYVRQRSPWKSAFELSDLTDHNSFVEFIEQIAIATATSVSTSCINQNESTHWSGNQSYLSTSCARSMSEALFQRVQDNLSM
jgi:uncharacterized protein (DUF2252 family)